MASALPLPPQMPESWNNRPMGVYGTLETLDSILPLNNALGCVTPDALWKAVTTGTWGMFRGPYGKQYVYRQRKAAWTHELQHVFTSASISQTYFQFYVDCMGQESARDTMWTMDWELPTDDAGSIPHQEAWLAAWKQGSKLSTDSWSWPWLHELFIKVALQSNALRMHPRTVRFDDKVPWNKPLPNKLTTRQLLHVWQAAGVVEWDGQSYGLSTTPLLRLHVYPVLDDMRCKCFPRPPVFQPDLCCAECQAPIKDMPRKQLDEWRKERAQSQKLLSNWKRDECAYLEKQRHRRAALKSQAVFPCECGASTWSPSDTWNYAADPLRLHTKVAIAWSRLRPYQEQLLRRLMAGQRLPRQGLIQAPCGAGKTIMAVLIAAVARVPTLVLAPSNLHNWAQEVAAFTSWSRDCVCLVTGKTTEHDMLHKPVVLVTFSMLFQERVFSVLQRRAWGIKMVDEVHSAVNGKTWDRVLKLRARCFLGWSATLVHESQKGAQILKSLPLLAEFKLDPMVHERYLSQVSIEHWSTKTVAARIQALRDILAHELKTPYHRVVVFCERLATVDRLAQWLATELKVTTATFTGQLKPLAKRRAMTGFREGHIRVLVCGPAANQSYNINPDVVLELQGKNSRTQFLQRVGRAQRKMLWARNCARFISLVTAKVDARMQLARKHGYTIKHHVYSGSPDAAAKQLARVIDKPLPRTTPKGSAKKRKCRQTVRRRLEKLMNRKGRRKGN